MDEKTMVNDVLSMMNSSLAGYANIIAQESVGGWALVTSMPVTVATTKKRFKGTDMPYNVLVFERERYEEDKPQ